MKREINIVESSECLLIALKRFDGFGKKIKHYVFCPALLNLSFSDENSSQDSSTSISSYRLKSICFHSGDSIKNGTFSSIVWCEKEKIWKNFNDSNKVIVVKNEQDFIKLNHGKFQPYMLFYRKSSKNEQNEFQLETNTIKEDNSKDFEKSFEKENEDEEIHQMYIDSGNQGDLVFQNPSPNSLEIRTTNQDQINVNSLKNIGLQCEERNEIKTIEIQLVNRGLKNLNNTCFMNSIVQSLNVYSEYLNKLIEYKFETNDFMEFNYERFALLDSYCSLVYNGFNVNMDRRITIDSLTNEFVNDFFCQFFENLGFIRKQQQDAHEFLNEFLNYNDRRIIEVELKKRGIEIENVSQIAKFDELRFNLSKKFFSIDIHKIYICPGNANHCVIKEETLKNLIELAIPFDTIEENLANYFTESVEKRCEECNSQENLQFMVQGYFENFEDYMIIQLKRFKSESNQFVKITKYANLSLNLNPSNFSSDSMVGKKETNLELAAISLHHGNSIQSGHYTNDIERDFSMNSIKTKQETPSKIKRDQTMQSILSKENNVQPDIMEYAIGKILF
ncbi:unnamed protein product [Brachionus calyciflorus]|uniref:USP domain-containing protein n=1 Tax=Brachionus calyciflorus TaxID=104777 RepID=A0A813ZVU2_9BILA|nr:unnamed protein product [Brachionus calyciflorus]